MSLLQHSLPGLKDGFQPAEESRGASLLTTRYRMRNRAAVITVSMLFCAPLLAETPSHQGHNHEPAKPAPSRLIKPGTVLPPRMAPIGALQPNARVELINVNEELPEPPKAAAASAPLPDPVAPRTSLQPQAVFKPFAIAR